MLRRCATCVTTGNILRALAALSIVFICSNIILLWNRDPLTPAPRPKFKSHGDEQTTRRIHPIDTLMADAETDYQALISGLTTHLHSTAEAYRQKRGRHPPPGFEAWYQYAQKKDAVIVEEFFDQIYHDLTPFWAIPAKDMRNHAKHFEHHISVRNGTASMSDNHSQGTSRDRMEAWLDTVKSIQSMLPDLDMAINIMDESRVLMPWEEIDKYVQTERKSRKLLPQDEVTSQYAQSNVSDDQSGEPPKVDWIGPSEPYWEIARVGCAPQAPARYQAAATDFTGPPPIPAGYPKHSEKGYVKNWTLVRDPCQYSYLQEAHGSFIEPISIKTTRSPVPIFGESKLPFNNDILIPPAAYLSDSFSRGDYSDKKADQIRWPDKKAGAVWRGVASGGRNKKENWTRFHRHRLISMLDGSYIRNLETSPHGVGQAPNFFLQSYATYKLTAAKLMDLGTWLDRIANVGFTKLLCFPATEKPTCPYTDPYFKIADQIPMKEQYKYKFLPDVDGNSFSGRYLAFLRSGSVPIKATIYSEWHDDRLVPWVHFVPMDNSFVDVYGILDYFIGTGEDKKNAKGNEATMDLSHDEAAKKIAQRGQEWANTVLRREDMQIYMLRLLLEYARLCSEDREKLGYVEDLRGKDKSTDTDSS